MIIQQPIIIYNSLGQLLPTSDKEKHIKMNTYILYLFVRDAKDKRKKYCLFHYLSQNLIV